MTGCPLGVSCLGLLVALTQVPVPRAPPDRAELGFALPTHEEYGTPMQVSLWELARGRDLHQKKAVITSGYVDPFEAGYVRLTETGAAVLLVPINDGMAARMRAVWGKQVEVTGVVRMLTQPQPPCGPLHWSVCEDPDLPQLPDLGQGRAHWPRVSLTVWAVLDAAPGGAKREAESGARLLQEIAASPRDFAGTSVTIVGQFRGHNLLGDLPERRWGREDDWVLKSGDAAVWVTGRRPRGKGWALEIDYEPDTRFWLEVTGEVTVAGGVACVKARSVALAKPASRR